MATLSLLIVFPGLMAFAAVSDMLTMTISNKVCLLLVSSFLVFALYFGMPLADIGWHLCAGLLVLAVCFVMFSAGWMGGGDAKLAAGTAVWLGFMPLFDYLMATALLGGLLTLGLLQVRALPLPTIAQNWEWTRRLHAANSGIPYGIALATAGLIVFPESPLWQLAVASRG